VAVMVNYEAGNTEYAVRRADETRKEPKATRAQLPPALARLPLLSSSPSLLFPARS
jgi:hypothetical protein